MMAEGTDFSEKVIRFLRENGFQNRGNGFCDGESGFRDRGNGFYDSESGFRDRENGFRDSESGFRDRESGFRNRESGFREASLSARENGPRAGRYYTDAAAGAAARLIRSAHKVLARFPGCPRGMTVCNNSLSPDHFLFQNETPVAIVGWEKAAFGDPLEDVAYAAWKWLDIGNPDLSAKKCLRRLRRFLSEYGTDEAAAVTEKIRAQMEAAERSTENSQAERELAGQCLAWVKENL